MIFLLIVSLIWAFSFGLIKDNLTGLDSNFVSFARLFLSLVIFLPLLKFKKLNGILTLKLILAGAIQYGLMYIAYIYSFQFLKAYEVALFTVFTPLYVTVIHNIIKRRFHVMFFITALIAIFGTWIIKYEDFSQSNLLLGFLIVQVSNIGFAFGQVYYKEIMRNYPDTKDQDVFGILYLGGVALTALSTSVFTQWTGFQISSNQILILIYLGVIASGVAFFLWNYGARRVNIGALAIFNNLKVPLAIFVSLVFFGETTNISNLLIGGLIVLFALVINEIYVHRYQQDVEM